MVHVAPALDSRALLAGDSHRPRYHFLPPSNWLNDPNGLIQWKGQYHLFYQYNPFEPVWGSIHWAHAVSDDLVHWRDLPIALAPTPGSVDEYGVFSGCAFDSDGVASVMYTGVRRRADGSRVELPCLATSTDDDLVRWEKYRGNPVITSPPPGFDVLGFRDHGVWREGSAWYQVIGSGIRGVGGTVFLYRSSDLIHWEYMHPICTGDRGETGEMWECPDLFPLGGAHVLMISPIPLHKTLYFVGSFNEHRFAAQRRGVVDDGGYFYAPQSFTDQRGRRVMFGWLMEGRDAAAQRAAGWAGVMSLPRVLQLGADGSLRVEPAPELNALRGRHHRVESTTVSPTTPMPVGVQGTALEIAAEFPPSRDGQVGLMVRCAPDGSEQTLIAFDPASGWLSIDRQDSSKDSTVDREPHGTQLTLAAGENLTLRVFLDRSVIEVYANARATLTSRIYPSRDDSLGVELFAREAPARLKQLDVWEMASVWDANP